MRLLLCRNAQAHAWVHRSAFPLCFFHWSFDTEIYDFVLEINKTKLKKNKRNKIKQISPSSNLLQFHFHSLTRIHLFFIFFEQKDFVLLHDLKINSPSAHQPTQWKWSFTKSRALLFAVQQVFRFSLRVEKWRRCSGLKCAYRTYRLQKCVTTRMCESLHITEHSQKWCRCQFPCHANMKSRLTSFAVFSFGKRPGIMKNKCHPSGMRSH